MYRTSRWMQTLGLHRKYQKIMKSNFLQTYHHSLDRKATNWPVNFRSISLHGHNIWTRPPNMKPNKVPSIAHNTHFIRKLVELFYMLLMNICLFVCCCCCCLFFVCLLFGFVFWHTLCKFVTVVYLYHCWCAAKYI